LPIQFCKEISLNLLDNALRRTILGELEGTGNIKDLSLKIEFEFLTIITVKVTNACYT